MGKNERRNSTQNMKKAGITHPSKPVSDPNKFIQYPGNIQSPPGGKKTLKPDPAQYNQRKSRKTVRKPPSSGHCRTGCYSSGYFGVYIP